MHRNPNTKVLESIFDLYIGENPKSFIDDLEKKLGDLRRQSDASVKNNFFFLIF